MKQRLFNYILTTILILFCSLNASAQISGVVTDSLTNEPIMYVIVQYEGEGVGTVTNIVNGGRDFEVTVLFDTYGVKNLLASFANLKKC